MPFRTAHTYSLPGRGTTRVPQARPAGREVEGPYRSQSSNPAIRRQATPSEHRVIANPFSHVDHLVARQARAFAIAPTRIRFDPRLGYGVHGFGTPTSGPPIDAQLANLQAGLEPLSGLLSPGTSHPHPVESKRLGSVQTALLRAAQRQQEEREPSTLTDLSVAAALSPIGPEAILARLGLAGAGRLIAGARAIRGVEGAASVTEGAATAARLARVARGAGTGARVAARVATAPIRHPFLTAGATFGAQAPLAALHGPGEFKKALEGTGVAARTLGAISGAASHAIPGVLGHAAGDLLSLPAQVVPTVYLTGRAGVEAALGHPQEAEALGHGFLNTSALAALATGHPGEALHRFGEHPLYAALEAAGVKAALGHGAGALARATDHVPQLEGRPALNAYGSVQQERAPYSRDLITRALQQRADAKRPLAEAGRALKMTPREISKHLASAVDREIFAGEEYRRGMQRRDAHELNAAKPAGTASADATRLAVEGYARNPETAKADLQGYRAHLLEQQQHLAPSFLEANKALVKVIDSAIAHGDPHEMFRAAEAYVNHQAPVTAEMVKLGLIGEHQAAKAVEIPYARTHMGAGHGLSNEDTAMLETIKGQMKGAPPEDRLRLLSRFNRIRARRQVLDAKGDPLPLEAIREHMAANGVTEHGYVSQRLPRPGGPRSFFQPPTEHPTLPSGARTGEAASQGGYEASWQALVDQATHNRSIVVRAQNFRHLMDRFALRAPGGHSFASYDEALHAAEHPADYGMKLPDVPGGWVPARLSPWLARKEIVDATGKLGSSEAAPLEAKGGAEGFQESLAHTLTPGDGPSVLIPKLVADRLRAHYQGKLPMEKAAEAVTGAFKGAVLPTSPGWAAGNAIDNYIVRAFGTGITPRDMAAGKGFADLITQHNTHEVAARALESIVPGGLYGGYARIQPYRALEQFAGTRIEPMARAAHAFLTTPGVKTLASLYRTYRDAVFELDSKYVEQLPQYGQLAKSARQELGLTRSAFRRAVAAQEPVVVDLARGFRNPELVDRFAKEVETVFGNWGKNGPEARRFLNTWSPFWMWGRAAMKFAFLTLPRDHPVLTGLLAAGEQMTREERQKLGFDAAGPAPLPDFLQGGIPDPWNKGGAVKLSNLTTFGTFADLPQFLSQIPAPQFSSAIFSGMGLDWKGDKLVKADGTPASALEKVKAAAIGTAEGFMPFLNLVRSIAKHGPVEGVNPLKRYPASTVQYLRQPKRQINVAPAGSGGSSSTNPFDHVQLGGSSGSSSSNPFDNVQIP